MSRPPQLEMRLTSLDALPDPKLPDGVVIRSFQAEDEDAWARIMNECIGSGWTAERCINELVDQPGFRADGCFLALLDGAAVGSATAFFRDRHAPWGYLHMVGVVELARGHGLGTLLSLAALHWFRVQGYPGVLLHTDDWRLPAIRIYLNLGFLPEMTDPSHPDRWDRIRTLLTQRR